MISGTNTVATTIHGPCARVNSATEGALPPGATGASIRTMKLAMVTTAQVQLASTTSNSALRGRGASSPTCPSAACRRPVIARCVSGARSVTSAIAAITTAITPNTRGQAIRAASISAKAPPMIEAVR